MTEDNATDRGFTSGQKSDPQISMDYTGEVDNIPSLYDIEEDDEFEDFASQSWSQGQEESSDSCMWDENWDDGDLNDEFTNQLRAELMDASRNE